MNDLPVSTRDLLNAQTGRVSWEELARHFARGAVVCVDPAEDLVQVAEQLVEDSPEAFESIQVSHKIKRADDCDAIRWQQNRQEFWAVVVAPWVLVQETAS